MNRRRASTWKSSCLRQLLPRLLAIRVIEIQQRSRGTADRCQRDDASVGGAKMFRPRIRSRIEEAHDDVRFRIDRRDVRAFEAITLEARQREVLEFCSPAVLRRDDVIRLVSEENAGFRDPTVLAAVTGALTHGGSQRSGNPRRAHAGGRRASTSALMSDTKRSNSHISSNSACSAEFNVPSRLCCRSSCARAVARSEGRNAMISSAEGCRARKEITSRRSADPADQVCRSPRAMISARRSRSGPNSRASWSGMSMVTCIGRRLAESGVRGKPRNYDNR